ncbi:MAG: hypothetical protein Q9169_003646 [Polycauliona sp. 2 TL-2023]
MTESRAEWKDSAKRPDQPGADYSKYHLIRLYSRDSKIALQDDPTAEMLGDQLHRQDGDVLWICKNVDNVDGKILWDSYFVIMKTSADEEIRWEESPVYLKADPLWDPPDDWRKRTDLLARARESFTATAATMVFHQHTKIADFFRVAVSQFEKNASDTKAAMDSYREALEAWEAYREDEAEAEAEAEAERNSKKSA